MKKIFILCLAIFIFISLSACGEKDTTKASKTDNNDKIDYKVSDSTRKSIDVPVDYPSDILPVYKNGVVFAVSKQQKGYSLVILSNDDVNTIEDYYKSLIKNANIISDVEEEDLYETMGSRDGYTFYITVTNNDITDDFKTALTLIVFPGEMPSTGLDLEGTNPGNLIPGQ